MIAHLSQVTLQGFKYLVNFSFLGGFWFFYGVLDYRDDLTG